MRSPTFAIIVATYGDRYWAELAEERAIPSADRQNPDELLVRHEKADGLAASRNRATYQARSSHLIFLDADDELAPGYLEAMRRALAVLTAPSLDRDRPRFSGPSLLVPQVQEVDGGREREPAFPNRHRPMEELNHCVIGTSVPRLMFKAVGGFRADLPIYEDWALFLACRRLGARLVDVHGAVYRAWRSPGGRNLQPSRVRRAAYDRIRREHLIEAAKLIP